MKAAPEDQIKLLDLQSLDKTIAGLKHELATLPAAQKLKEITTIAAELQSKIALATSKKNDLTRAQKNAEAEVDKVQERAKTQRQRLDSGQSSPKEMERIQEELAQLAARQGNLEDAALEAMDAVEQATGQLEALKEKQAQLSEEKASAAELATHETEAIQGKLDAAQNERDALAASLPAELVSEYEACRRSSGIGVVEVQGGRTVGVQLMLSVAEVSRLEAAAPDEVVVSENHEVILVRK